MRRKFDAENIGGVAGRDARIQRERFGKGVGVVGPDIEVCVVRSTRQEVSRSRPAVCCQMS